MDLDSHSSFQDLAEERTVGEPAKVTEVIRVQTRLFKDGSD